MKARLQAHRFTLWMGLLSGLVALSFFTSALILSEQSDLGRESRERLCLVAGENRRAMRNILLVARADRLANAASPDEAERILNHYDRLLALVPPLDCGRITTP